MKNTERYTSFILERSNVSVVEIAHNQRGFTLTAAGSFDSEIDFDQLDVFESPGMDKRVKTFASEIQSFQKRIGAGSKHFSFGLNSRMVMLQKIPVEMSLTDEEFNIHLEWELRNFYPDAQSDNYTIIPYALIDFEGNPGTNGMVIGVRKSFVNFLSNVSEKCYGMLNVIDVDQFCAETALLHNYPQSGKIPTAVVGIDEETLDCSLLINGKDSNISTMRWNGLSDMKKIADFAKSNAAEQIFLHGRLVNEMTGEQLKQFTPLPVEVSDPFKKISLPQTIKNIDEIKLQRQKYTAAVGLALRTE